MNFLHFIPVTAFSKAFSFLREINKICFSLMICLFVEYSLFKATPPPKKNKLQIFFMTVFL